MFDELDEMAKKRKMVGQPFPLKYNYFIQLVQQQQNVSISMVFVILFPGTAYLQEIGDLSNDEQDTNFCGVSREMLGTTERHGNDIIFPNRSQIERHSRGETTILVRYYGTKHNLQLIINILETCIVSYKNKWTRSGVLSKTHLDEVLKEYPTHYHDKLVYLLGILFPGVVANVVEMFEVLYKLNSREYIVPCLLDSKASKEFFELEVKQVRSSYVHPLRLSSNEKKVVAGYTTSISCRLDSSTGSLSEYLRSMSQFEVYGDGGSSSRDKDSLHPFTMTTTPTF